MIIELSDPFDSEEEDEDEENGEEEPTEEELKEELEREGMERQREIEEAEEHRLRIEFSTNIIAARRYSLSNVIPAGQGFHCEIVYLPFHNLSTFAHSPHFTRRFELLMTSREASLECTETREGWDGSGTLHYAQEIERSTAEFLSNRAMIIFFSIFRVPEGQENAENFLRGHGALREQRNNREVMRLVHDHTQDLEIADLCADVEVEFLRLKMWR